MLVISVVKYILSELQFNPLENIMIIQTIQKTIDKCLYVLSFITILYNVLADLNVYYTEISRS